MDDVPDKVLREIDNSRQELVAFLQELVRIPTVNPPGENYAECARFIGRKFEESGIHFALIEPARMHLESRGLHFPRTSVTADLPGSEHKPVLNINGHMDVVPVGSGWTVEPFGGAIYDGKIYGRGTTDMKGGIAAAVMAAIALRRSGVELRGDLVISATPDEETGGEMGAGFLLANSFVKGDAAIIAEGAELSEVSLAHKGALWMELKTIGKAAHASSPDLGINAVTNMAKIILAIDGLAQELKTKRTPTSHLFYNVPGPVLTVGGTISGGVKTNVVPDSCVVTLDRRLLPEETMEEAEKQILSIVERLTREDPRLKVEVRTVLRVPPTLSSRDSNIAAAIIQSVAKVNGNSPRLMGTWGFTDAHFFAQKMPTVMYGPGISAKAHQTDEYVEIDHVLRVAKVFALTAIKMLS